jgi:hypothetical protein
MEAFCKDWCKENNPVRTRIGGKRKEGKTHSGCSFGSNKVQMGFPQSGEWTVNPPNRVRETKTGRA